MTMMTKEHKSRPVEPGCISIGQMSAIELVVAVFYNDIGTRLCYVLSGTKLYITFVWWVDVEP